MTIRKALSLWAIGSVFWMGLTAADTFEHYAPLLKESSFIYNPMMAPLKLIASSTENRQKLLFSYLGNNSRIVSFGEPGIIRIEFVIQSINGSMTHTWMPYNGSFSLVDVSTKEWTQFKRFLTTLALEQRESLIHATLHQHLLKDLCLLLGIPLLLLAVILAFMFNRHIMDHRTGHRFPDI